MSKGFSQSQSAKWPGRTGWAVRATAGQWNQPKIQTGKKISARGLTYYRLDNGQIVEDDPVSTPELLQHSAYRRTRRPTGSR